MTNATLQVSNVRKTFAGLAAVRDVSFTAVAHRVFGIIGQNGAGKTTLFNLIAGTLFCDAGTIELKGKKVSAIPGWLRSRHGIARTFQVPKPVWSLDVRDNVQLGLAAYGVDNKHSRELADAQLETMGLAQVASAMPASLSPGQLRLLEFARAAVAKPTLLLLDEVFAGLTLAEQEA